ncbi:MAG TPA: hypothetical protein VMC83_26665 [Streptosporangiaceae bacterium]|nr:hypothetical protein [Streptosporangiaceae bacterium]
MVELVIVGIAAGFLAAISPCVLPVLPVVLVAGAGEPAGPPPAHAVGAGGPAAAEPAPGIAFRRVALRRPLAVIAGLVLSFSLLILVGSELLSLLHLPQDSLRDAGIALLIVVGLGYLIPPIGGMR